jgi:hypothetical protein
METLILDDDDSSATDDSEEEPKIEDRSRKYCWCLWLLCCCGIWSE